MQIKSILLTGDDGYNSIGTRLLAHFLHPKYDVKIAATKQQQSGMGGKINIKGGTYGEALIENVPALWVDGSPADAVEAAVNHYRQEFDLIISGINLGANVAGSIISSGTFSAVFRALNLGLSQRGIALSWNIPPAQWFMDHSPTEPLDAYLAYPGQTALDLLHLILKEKFWNASLLNINFPENPTHEVVFTRPLQNINNFFLPVELDNQTMTFRYPGGVIEPEHSDMTIDVHALQAGKITITPCRADFLDPQVYDQTKQSTHQLPHT